jgi:hypothetical protein
MLPSGVKAFEQRTSGSGKYSFETEKIGCRLREAVQS